MRRSPFAMTLYRKALFILCIGVLVFFFGISCMRANYKIPERVGHVQVFGQGEAAAFNDTLRVLIWNVYKGKAKSWEDDFRRITETADIVLVQEAHLPSRMKDILTSRSTVHWDYAESFLYVSSGEGTGVATGSRVRSAEATSFRSSGREPILGTPKMALLTRYPIEGREEQLLVVNVHALLVVTTKRFREQMDAIRTEIEKHQGPVILAGDFNTWASSRLRVLDEMNQALGLSAVSFDPDSRTRAFGHPIDHAFIRGYEVVSSKVHGELSSSDHKALEVFLRLSQSL